jgi:hypothetical protein
VKIGYAPVKYTADFSHQDGSFHASAAMVAALSATMNLIDSLLAAMTLEEKIGQLNMAATGHAITGPILGDEVAEDIRAGRVGGLLNLWGREAIAGLQKLASIFSVSCKDCYSTTSLSPFFRGAHSSGMPNMLANHVIRAASRLPHHGFPSANPAASTVAASRLVNFRNLPVNARWSASSLANSLFSGVLGVTALWLTETLLISS